MVQEAVAFPGARWQSTSTSKICYWALSAARAMVSGGLGEELGPRERRTSTGHFPRLFQPDSALAEAIRPRGSVLGDHNWPISGLFSLPSKFALIANPAGKTSMGVGAFGDLLRKSSEVLLANGKSSAEDFRARFAVATNSLKSSEADEQKREVARKTAAEHLLRRLQRKHRYRLIDAECWRRKGSSDQDFSGRQLAWKSSGELLAPAQVGRKTSDLNSSGTELPRKSPCLDFRRGDSPGKSAQEVLGLLQNLRKTCTADFPPAPTARKTSNEHLAQRHLARKSSGKGGAPLQLLPKRSVPAFSLKETP